MLLYIPNIYPNDASFPYIMVFNVIRILCAVITAHISFYGVISRKDDGDAFYCTTSVLRLMDGEKLKGRKVYIRYFLTELGKGK